MLPAAEANVCSKCQRPFEPGDDEHICCAGERIEWSCSSCQKVSEGFAFPYGLCPLCGGTLVRGHHTPVAGEAAVEAIRRALEIELGGMSFYMKGAEEVKKTDPELAELFNELAGMEKEHMEILTRRYHVAAPDAVTSENLTPTQVAVFSGLSLEDADAAALLRLAVHLEKRARAFFLDAGKQFETGSPEWKLYRELEAEEREHVARLSTVLGRMAAGKAAVM